MKQIVISQYFSKKWGFFYFGAENAQTYIDFVENLAINVNDSTVWSFLVLIRYPSFSRAKIYNFFQNVSAASYRSVIFTLREYYEECK